VTRKNNGLVQKAVEFFVGDRVVCSNFEMAKRLQRELGCKNIVTLDGTEFKKGMISGGQHHQNLFDLKLG